MYIRLVQDFGLESEVAKHLAHTYGDRAFSVAKLASLTGKRWPIGKYQLSINLVMELISQNLLKS
ncbi:Glycerol-3-phosphate dehydrogenase, mitochondrial [Portunus trituberculatus]|uniref:Glycerol-3-phosphate dehydrogenase, mitochondrial n=1 Tax=Portunus trituberculatus TaxID=210409 RepID=A0A5B7KLR5_PORTR|nr:Glycerol-3-phosphate dehydrogenase, mitochondrial [Portunus trituberculatus]